MYDDNVTVRVGVNWKEIVIKVVLLIIFILILCWLFPKPDLDIFYDSVYTTNINTMKEAAKSYYTTDKMPSAVGESTSMTLKEMVDNHMIIRFTDKNGNYCDESSSKVEVTKISDKEYALKVVLNCGDEKDYIIETIGCNSVCTGENCTIINNNYVSNNTNGNGNNNSGENGNGTTSENGNGNGTNNNGSSNGDVTYNEDGSVVIGSKDGYNDTSYTIDTVYYQFRKAITNYSTVYTCPTGYVKNGTQCSKYVVGATIDATPVYNPDTTIEYDAKLVNGESVTVYADPIKTANEVTYTCPDGYTKNGAYCIKYTDAKENIVTSYTCPSGYTKNGTKCTYTYDAKYNDGKTSYTCPKGGTLSGTKCTITSDATSSTTYSCPSGYTKNGTSCYKVYDATYTAGATSYTCPSGYTKNGNKCYKTYDAKYTAGSTSYTCPSGYTRNGTKCYKTYDAKYTAGATSYTCPSGYTKNGTKCYKTYDAKYTAGATTYTCPSGYTKNGTNCYYTYNATYTAGKTTYSCPSGGSLSGTKCTITKNATSSTSYTNWVSQGTYYYTTASKAYTGDTSKLVYGGTITGAKCGSPCGNSGIWYYYTYYTRSTTTSYSCPSGYTRNGSSCYYTYNATASTAQGSYSCPNGGSLSGTKCTITKTATSSTGKGVLMVEA